MDDLLRFNHAGSRCVRTGAIRSALARFDECGRRIVKCDRAKHISVAEVQLAELGPTNPCRVLQHGLEYRLQLARRTANDLQHAGSRGLPLKRLAQLAEQTGILDRYCGLIRESLQKSNMLVLERTYFGAPHQDRTKRVALSNQRHAKDGAMAPFERELPSQWELSPCVLQISYMYGLLVTNGPPHNSCAVERHRFPASHEAANFADGGPDAHHAVFDDNNVNELRLADAGSVLGNRLENRHYVARRARDHAQDIADRGLLL